MASEYVCCLMTSHFLLLHQPIKKDGTLTTANRRLRNCRGHMILLWHTWEIWHLLCCSLQVIKQFKVRNEGAIKASVRLKEIQWALPFFSINCIPCISQHQVYAKSLVCHSQSHTKAWKGPKLCISLPNILVETKWIFLLVTGTLVFH